uniref:Uncharacterized protein n=1 Tax=Guillardia theta TaxID=55529 RepID=A0A6U6CCP2_GUITH|mmetsp:Transcript_4601/g.16753  ORF Transcript_4601/g.16753 Transcript_4601/m.16753 type:complete len:133 (+) Transcript_4601:234-632(+)
MEMVQLVKICLQFLCSSDTETFVEKSTSYADRHEMNIGALKGSLRGLLNFFKGAARKYLSQALIQEDMMRFGKGGGPWFYLTSSDRTLQGFDENRAKIVASSWQAHFLALSRGIAGQVLPSLSPLPLLSLLL